MDRPVNVDLFCGGKEVLDPCCGSRMGGEPGCEAYIPRPKGMRLATYERVVQEVRELENAGFLAIAARFPSLRDMIW